MPIPRIESYPMPSVDDLPANVARWRPDRRRMALLIHDLQEYFVDFFPAGVAPIADLLRNTVRIRQAARAMDIPIIYTAARGATTRAERGLLYDVWGPGMGHDPRSRRIVPQLAPSAGDVVLRKWRYSAFHNSTLEDVLAREGRDQLVVCGVYAHIGCLMTVCDAFSRDIEAFLVADAVADFTAAEHRLALDYAARRCAVTLTTGQLLTELTAPEPERCPGSRQHRRESDWPAPGGPVGSESGSRASGTSAAGGS
jgi:isochorismate hydrolase